MDVERLGYYEAAGWEATHPRGYSEGRVAQCSPASSSGYELSMKRIEGLVADEWSKSLSLEQTQRCLVRHADDPGHVGEITELRTVHVHIVRRAWVVRPPCSYSEHLDLSSVARTGRGTA